MYIEYVTTNGCKVLHQLRDVEEGTTVKGTMENAVKRLEATGFRRMSSFDNLAWTDGCTDAHIRFGVLADARKRAIGAIHELSILN